jgi:hypothetical protein
VDRSCEVMDDSGMMALVDPDAYQSYVDKDWDLEQLGGHFVAEMARRTLLIWPTGFENHWTVEVTDVPRALDPVDIRRQVTGLIEASRGRLLVTSYESLTMAAGYRDVTLPERYDMDNVIAVPAGIYTCQATLVWPGYPADDDGGDEAASRYVLTLLPGGIDIPPWQQAPWDRGDFYDD